MKRAQICARLEALTMLHCGKYDNRLLLCKTWPVRPSTLLSTEQMVTRSELEDVILPLVLRAAKAAGSTLTQLLAQRD